MAYLKHLLVLSSLLFSITSNAGWLTPEGYSISTGGYTGEYNVGIEYYHLNDMIETRWSIGHTDSIQQLNTEIVVKPFNRIFDKFNPLGVGMLIMLVKPNESSFFFDSPDNYPNRDYYDPTALRTGITLSQSYSIKDNLKMRWWTASTERQVVSYYNNNLNTVNVFSFGMGISFKLK